MLKYASHQVITIKYMNFMEKIKQLKNHLLENSDNQSWNGVNFTDFRQNNCIFTWPVTYKNKIAHFRESMGKNLIFQQPVLKKMKNFEYFWRSNCLFTKSNCKKLSVSATNHKKRTTFAGFQKTNCVFMQRI